MIRTRSMNQIKFWLMLFIVSSSTLYAGTHRPTGDPVFSNYFVHPFYQQERPIRVLVLPFAYKGKYAGSESDFMDSFVRELKKQNYFEVVQVEDVSGIISVEKIQAIDFIDQKKLMRLGYALNVDGVIVGTITEYNPYEPIILGARFSMYSTESGKKLWAVDEILDSRLKNVAQSARNFHRHEVNQKKQLFKNDLVLISMSSFTQYACQGWVRTLSAGMI